MAAPPSKTLKDLSGKWVMNSKLSDSADPALALQGIGWLTRKGIGLSTVTLHVKQFTAPPSASAEGAAPAGAPPVVHIEIDQTATGGIKGTSERRCVDGLPREHADWLFGKCSGRTTWIAADKIEDAFLKKDWIEGDAEKAGPNGETHLMSRVESLEAKWTATQIWGFQMIEGERRYVRNIVVADPTGRVEIKLIYDFIGEE